ncbi:MAG TPA: putative sulfate exporter family transporter [Rhabdaerophilum sp.]|nr:putative sulfate exporter family transporter [Rhabdaerophilum sp.]
MIYLPGLALSIAIAAAAYLAEPLLKGIGGGRLALPSMVIALLFGVALNPLAKRAIFAPGTTFSVKVLLRWAIALLGLRISLADLAGMGAPVALLTVTAMTITVIAGFGFTRLGGLGRGYGALAGASIAVCGASAALATATVLPDYRERSADIAFAVVMANAVSTLAMVGYPPLCAWLGFSPVETGTIVGITVHDMAQVVGAGYSISEPAGNAAVIVKLFRVMLLLPVVMLIGYRLAGRGNGETRANVPVPGFALAFLALVIVNSAAASLAPGSAAEALYDGAKAMLSELSRWGLLTAIAALGLGTSIGTVLETGWRHIAVYLAVTIVLFIVAISGVYFLR